MNLEAERKLKFDRRLHRRSGWITQQELDAEISALPDAASKIHVPEAEPEGDSGPGAEPGPAAGAPPHGGAL